VPVDLFGEAAKAIEAADAAEDDDDEEEAEDGEPEDDFNAAWEVLDLARALYEKGQDDDDEIKLKLADTYISLGDVSLETGQCRFIYSHRIHAKVILYREV
jgi:HAT1-interacting factor 1